MESLHKKRDHATLWLWVFGVPFFVGDKSPLKIVDVCTATAWDSVFIYLKRLTFSPLRIGKNAVFKKKKQQQPRNSPSIYQKHPLSKSEFGSSSHTRHL